MPYRCKETRVKKTREYRRTILGKIKGCYNNMRGSCNERGISPPSFTLRELINWTFKENWEIFIKLYDDWQRSNFNDWLAPSYDRIDDYGGYDLNNLQIMTWEENNAKGVKGRKNTTAIKRAKASPVLRLSKQGVVLERYESMRDAIVDGFNHTGIGKVCRGEQEIYKGYKWRYDNK